ncbi:hypothetical protein LIER_00459 [Lithospermum erythrorhizon]|uniref:Uncharacterized protein n=1 Tax=Lithospermum erythrorhizon TaxID=34254 RepID=A0AAV3NHI8_LITER
MNDQGLNARLMQEKNIGVEIPRNEKDGSFTSFSVANSIRLAMVSEEGESIRSNAMEMRNLFGDQNRHNSTVDSYVHYLMQRNLNTLPKIIPPKLDLT